MSQGNKKPRVVMITDTIGNFLVAESATAVLTLGPNVNGLTKEEIALYNERAWATFRAMSELSDRPKRRPA